MFGNSVSFRDYEGVQGFGIGSMNEVDELNKALEAGTQRPPASGGSALRVESLEATLRTVTFTLQNIKLWPKIPKLPAFSTVEEYNILSAYGDDAGVFTNEGDLPETQDATYERRTALVKFLGTTREVTHPMTLGQTWGFDHLPWASAGSRPSRLNALIFASTISGVKPSSPPPMGCSS